MHFWKDRFITTLVLGLALVAMNGCTLAFPSSGAGESQPPPAERPPGLSTSSPVQITHAETINTGFGEAVDISGDTLVIGATDFNVGWGEQFGSAYVYRQSGGEWLQQARLASSDGHDGSQYDQHFGRAVAIEGDVIAVGAPDADHPTAGGDSGAVYIFNRSGETWTESARLEAAEPQAEARFGSLLRLHGDTLAVIGDQGSAVYIFTRDGQDGSAWSQQARLEVEAPLPGEWSHVSLALYGDTVAVGATGSTPFDPNGSGVVFVFHRQGDTWAAGDSLEGKADFGTAVALGASAAAPPGAADTLAVGAGGDPRAGLNAGAVFIYGRDGERWSEQAVLTAADALMELPYPLPPRYFGSALALDSDLLLVGLRFSSVVYVCQGQGANWTDQLKVVLEDGLGEPEAWPIAIDGRRVVRGTPGEFGNSAFAFELISE